MKGSIHEMFGKKKNIWAWDDYLFACLLDCEENICLNYLAGTNSTCDVSGIKISDTWLKRLYDKLVEVWDVL